MLSDFILKKYGADGEVKSPQSRAKVGKFSGLLGIVCNILLFGSKLTAGFLSGSVSIIADAINNLSDAASNVISFFGFKMATRPADSEHPYGHGRYEYVSALTVALLIMVIGVELLREGIQKIITPTETEFGWIISAILVFSIVLKIWLCIFNSRLGKAINSNALLATSADSRNDAIATSAVLIAAIISELTGVNTDGFITLGVALFILYSGFVMVKNTLDPLLGKAPDKELVEQVRRKILSYEGVLGAHDLMVHDYGAGRLFASVHVEMSAENDMVKCHEIIDGIERDLLKECKLHTVIHLDPIPLHENVDLRMFLQDSLKKIDERLTLHDLKVVRDNAVTKLIFDCVAPADLKYSDEHLKELVCSKVKDERPDCECEITVDKNFAPIAK